MNIGINMEFQFVWYLTENDWGDRMNEIDEYIGCCRVGNLCFDILVRCDETTYLSYDCYIGGVDDGYGYGIDDYPYTYGDGGDWYSLLEEKSLAEFRELAEEEFSDFITENHLEDKANEPLHVW